MGYNIGVRIIDEFLAKTNINNCSNFKETSDMIAKVAFKMFLGINVEISNFNNEKNSFSLMIAENPFTGKFFGYVITIYFFFLKLYNRSFV